jgi:hypothetical protein
MLAAPACPWFHLPRAVGMLAAIAMSSFSSVVMSWSVGCPWILMTDSFLSSSCVSARSPILMNEFTSPFVCSDK